MTTWLLRRVASSLLLVVVVVTVVFFAVRLAPGNPLDQTVQDQLSGPDRALMRQRLGLDRGLGGQYALWLAGGWRGEWGDSLRQQRPVAHIIREALPPTLLLSMTGYALHVLLAVGAATSTTLRRRRWLDGLVQGAGLACYSVPAFWLGLMLVLLCSRLLGWLPAAGLQSPDAAFLPWPARLLDVARHLVLPATTLALSTFMGTARFLRASLDDVLAQDHILAARARGLGERRIMRAHALRGAMLPLVTLLGLNLPFLLGGAVVVETVFGWPGLGRVALEALWARDYPVIMATTAVSAVLVVTGSLLADVLYHWADPRVRLAGGGSS